MKTLNVVLGAGFSFNAGLPLVTQLSSKINTDYRNKLIRWSSSEWKWAEGQVATEIFTGRFGGEPFAVEYFLNEIINYYTSLYGPINNYEIFYDFLEQASDQWLNEVSRRAKEACTSEHKTLSTSVLERFDAINKRTVIDVVTFLLADSLVITKPLHDIISLYQHFLLYLDQYDRVNIHTLNHDLLLENLFRATGLPFSDGFSSLNSELMDSKGEEFVPTYQGIFDQKVSILKLHGSIDLIRYQVADDSGYVVQTTGRKIYFKPKTYLDKHSLIRIDPATKTPIQKFHWEVVPSFITGLTKPRKITSDYMYKDLFRVFTDNIRTEDADLLMIGYSYGDAHVNEVIQQAPSGTPVTNINPTWKFPFKKFQRTKDYDYMEIHGALKV